MTIGRLSRILWLVLSLSLLPVACSTQHGRNPEGQRSPAQINAELGVRYMQQGNLDVALDKLKRALEQDPKLAAAHHYIALLYNRLGSPDLAEKHFQRALERCRFPSTDARTRLMRMPAFARCAFPTGAVPRPISATP